MEAISEHEPASIWRHALKDLELQMSPADFRTWFSATELASCDGPVCTVHIENPMTKGWLDSKCKPLVARTLRDLLGRSVDVEFTVRSPRGVSARPATLELEAPTGARKPRKAATEVAEAPRLPLASSRFRFDNFVVGSSNRLAYAAAVAAAEKPGHANNPLFIYGSSGLGKTHLLHAIGHFVRQSDLRVMYVSSETFTNEFIESVSRGKMESFRERYRAVNVLLLDDIQFIAGKEGTQEEFFHTFNAVYEAGGQIVLASDRPPHALSLAQRLQSRFGGGLVADVQSPDLETRAAILRGKAAARGADLPMDALQLIAERVTSNVRDLEGALNRVIAQAQLLNAPVTVDLAARALEHSAGNAQTTRGSDPDAIIKAVCKITGITRRAIEGSGRDRRTATARQIAMYLIREGTSLSLSEIGMFLGSRDHTTVLHGHAKLAAAVASDEKLRQTIAAIQDQLRQESFS